MQIEISAGRFVCAKRERGLSEGGRGNGKRFPHCQLIDAPSTWPSLQGSVAAKDARQINLL